MSGLTVALTSATSPVLPGIVALVPRPMGKPVAVGVVSTEGTVIGFCTTGREMQDKEGRKKGERGKFRI